MSSAAASVKTDPMIDEEKQSDGIPEATAASQAPTFPDGGLRAWLVVLGASIINGCSFGYASSFGVYQAYYQRNQLSAYSPSSIAWIGSLQLCFMFAGGFFSGPVVDRYGVRILMIPGTIGYVLSVMFTSICTQYWHFILAQGIFGGVCNGLLFSPAFSVIGQYFNKKRGAALGLIAVGSCIGGTLFPIALERAFYSHVGFAWGVRAVGFVMLVLLLIACGFVVERLPRRASFRPIAPEAFRNTTYIGIIAGVFFLFWGVFTVLFFVSDYGLEKVHMSNSMAFYVLSIINGSSVVGRMGGGIIGDKLGFVPVLCGIAVINSIMVFTWNSTTSNTGLVVWSVIFGMTSGGTFSLFPAALITAVPDPRSIGTWLGQAMLIFSIAGLTGSPISGAIVQNYGFERVGIFGGVCLLVGGAFIGAAWLSQIRAKKASTIQH